MLRMQRDVPIEFMVQKYVDFNINVTDAREANLRGENVCISTNSFKNCSTLHQKDYGTDVPKMKTKAEAMKSIVNVEYHCLRPRLPSLKEEARTHIDPLLREQTVPV